MTLPRRDRVRLKPDVPQSSVRACHHLEDLEDEDLMAYFGMSLALMAHRKMICPACRMAVGIIIERCLAGEGANILIQKGGD